MTDRDRSRGPQGAPSGPTFTPRIRTRDGFVDAEVLESEGPLARQVPPLPPRHGQPDAAQPARTGAAVPPPPSSPPPPPAAAPPAPAHVPASPAADAAFPLPPVPAPPAAAPAVPPPPAVAPPAQPAGEPLPPPPAVAVDGPGVPVPPPTFPASAASGGVTLPPPPSNVGPAPSALEEIIGPGPVRAAGPVDLELPSADIGLPPPPTSSTGPDITLPPPPTFAAPEPAAVHADTSDPEPAPEPEPAAPAEPEPAAADALPEPPAPKHAIIYRGTLDMPNVHSICSLNLKENYDEIAPALAVFDKLGPGEHAFLRFSVRPAAPDTRTVLQEQLHLLDAGEPLEQPPAWKRMLGTWGRYTGEMVAYILKAGSGSRKAQPPAPPWRPEEVRKPGARVQAEEEKYTINFAREKVQAGRYYECRLHIGALGSADRAEDLDAICQLIQAEFNASYSNGASLQGFSYRKVDPLEGALGLMKPCPDDSAIVSTAELGEMAKIPDKETNTGSVYIDYGKRTAVPREPFIVEDPLNPPPGMLPMGEIYVGSRRHCAIAQPIKGLNTHMYICGTTGSGKSTLTEWYTYGLAKQGKCVFLIDPHGTLVDNVVDNILAFAPERADDVLILDFGDLKYPISFNPLAITSANQIEPTVQAVKEMILKMLNLNPDSAPRAVQYVEKTVWCLCEVNLHALSGHRNLALNLLDVPEFLTNTEFRHLCVQFSQNLTVRSNFLPPNGIYEQLGERAQMDHVMPVLRAFDSLSTKDSFGNIFGQSENTIDFARWVREQKLVLMKLPAIASDSSVATFIGAMATPMLIGSLSSWGHEEHLSAYLIIDEFQNYATDSFEALLAQTRKHGLYGIAINQIPQALPPVVLRGVQSNTQSKISMRLDPQAVKAVSDFIASGEAYPRTDDIVGLDNFWGWANLSYGSTKSGPFLFKGLAPPLDDDGKGNPVYAFHKNGMADVEAGRANIARLLPQVQTASRLATAKNRDKVWEKRQTHLRDVRAVLERKIKEKTRRGGFDGSTGSQQEEILRDMDFS